MRISHCFFYHVVILRLWESLPWGSGLALATSTVQGSTTYGLSPQPSSSPSQPGSIFSRNGALHVL